MTEVGCYPATSWQLAQVAAAQDGLSTHCVPLALTLRGPLSRDRLEAALGGLVARHGALRARLVQEGGGWWMVVDDAAAAVVVSEVSDGVAAELERPINLTAGPLWRAGLHKEDGRHVMTLVADHGIMDGMAAGIVTSELAALYEGRQLAPAVEQFGDYAEWEAAPISRRAYEFWAKGLCTTRLYRPPLEQAASIPATLREVGRMPRGLLAEAARRYRVPASAVLATMMLRAVGPMAPPRLTFGLLVGGRELRWKGVVGCIADVLPVTVDLGSPPTFEDVATAIEDATERRVALRAIRHLLRPAVGEPLFDVGMNYLPGGSQSLRAGELEITSEIRQFARSERTLGGWYDAAALLDVLWREDGEAVVGYLCANGLQPDADLSVQVAARLKREMLELGHA